MYSVDNDGVGPPRVTDVYANELKHARNFRVTTLVVVTKLFFCFFVKYGNTINVSDSGRESTIIR